jgi:serine kinase of HPr protein (carbohydrate metabolism regulator)
VSPTLHAGLLALRWRGRWRGALVQGPAGAGKSDLALRALDIGFRLVADDRTQVWASGGRAWGRAPEVLSGLLEVRGLDVVRVPVLDYCRIDLAVTAGDPERLPEPGVLDLAGASVPHLVLHLTDASAPHRLKEALCCLGARPEESYQVSLPTPTASTLGESDP